MSQHDTHADAMTDLDDIEVCHFPDEFAALDGTWCICGNRWPCEIRGLIAELRAARATIAALQARCDAGEAAAQRLIKAQDRYIVMQRTAPLGGRNVSGIIDELGKARDAYAALRASQPTTEGA